MPDYLLISFTLLFIPFLKSSGNRDVNITDPFLTAISTEGVLSLHRSARTTKSVKDSCPLITLGLKSSNVLPLTNHLLYVCVYGLSRVAERAVCVCAPRWYR